MARRLTLIMLTVLLGLSTVAVAQARRDMTMQEYQTRLRECQDRQHRADSLRAAAEQRLTQLQQDMNAVDQQIAQTDRQIMDLVAADSAAIQDYMNRLSALEQRTRALRQLSPNQIVDARERGELDSIQTQLSRLKTNRMAALPEAQAKIQSIDRMLAEMRATQRTAEAATTRRDQYTVVRGDNLWNISKKPTIYADPFAWVRLYGANRDRIRNPNLIYPNWVLGVPRSVEPGTYWVKRGESLRSIAARSDVYGDPSQWTRLYRTNRDMIQRVGGSQRIIYPNMILDVPQR